MRKIGKRIFSVMLGFVTAVSLLPMQALAAGKIDVNRSCELIIQYNYGEKSLADVEFELYKVADISEYVQFTLTDDFKQYPIEIGEYSGAEWNELASTLDSYVSQDASKLEGPKAVDSGKTDVNGKLTFPNRQDSMTPGLYLVLGELSRNGDYRYTCDPAIVCIPGEDREVNDWIYNISIFPKSSRKYIPDDDNPVVTTVSRKVLKRWNDAGNEASRPDTIDVNLLKDGVVYESVTLSSSNNWSYTWTGLDKNAEWKVTEDVPDGYTVSISREGNTFVVKNTKLPTEVITDPEPPTGGDPTGVLGQHDENTPFGVLNAYDMLPQTGTTWWLVVSLAGAGMLLIAFGLLLRRKAE